MTSTPGSPTERREVEVQPVTILDAQLTRHRSAFVTANTSAPSSVVQAEDPVTFR
jgi:hypothetical protein